jgi:hypothetical protein
MMDLQEALAQYQADLPLLAARGVSLTGVTSYVPDGFANDYDLAMDAAPTLAATDPNGAIPGIFTTMVDPKVFEALFAPNKAEKIIGLERRGSWVDDTIMFPIVESVGEVSSYDDYSENGAVSANANWPQRQNYLYQVMKQYGDREVERAGKARIAWVSQLDKSAALMLNKFENLCMFYGVRGLQNYGLFNDPHLNASLTPALKGWGGTGWYNASNQIAATANEIYADVVSVFVQLVNQNVGLVDRETRMVLALSPQSEAGFTQTNSFNVNVTDLLKKNFPNLRVESAAQYGAYSTIDPQGNPAGNFMQLIAPEIEGQETVYGAFSEKMKAHRIEVRTSSYKQKVSGGNWGAIIRYAAGIASMVGI